MRLLERIKADLEPHSVVESFPRMEGRQMVMLLAPKKVQVQKPQAPKAQADKHHQDKPEAGKPAGETGGDKASPAAPAKPRPKESTTVGSK